jgi:hypothetical protein
LERTEWQLAPETTVDLSLDCYEVVCACALIIRVVSDLRPTEDCVTALVEAINNALLGACGRPGFAVAGYGWLAWTGDSGRDAFLQGLECERRLATSLACIERLQLRGLKVRWGIWVEQYILPFNKSGDLVIGEAGPAIFNFEPDNMLYCSEAIYQMNRRLEHFVCAPRRLLYRQDEFGYRPIGHKRASALDHAQEQHRSPFVGRRRQIMALESSWRRRGKGATVAILARAGSGKTRLVREWLARHPELRALCAAFSLFGGDIESFAAQLIDLPLHGSDNDRLIKAIADRVRRDKIHVMVLDDLHWAGHEGAAFIQRLLNALTNVPVLVILASRPSGQALVRALNPTATLTMRPLAPAAVGEIAFRLIGVGAVATLAARHSKGNPLFIEQFAAWAADTGFKGGEKCPHSLHELIAARIKHLSDVRMAKVRERLRWGRSWGRQEAQEELGKLEVEIGLWLDRLETGDYADRVEAAHYLAELERLDYEIFVAGALAGRPRPRSNRLREAIERLLIGSVEQILQDLRRQAVGTSGATKENILREAQRAGDILFADCRWSDARAFYELAQSIGPSFDVDEIDRRLAECRRRSKCTINESEILRDIGRQNIDTEPSVDSMVLPYVWARLALRYRRHTYFIRAAEAAEAINDSAFAAWARQKALLDGAEVCR